MSSPQFNIFITGATGYIGGTILTRLLEHKERGSFRITALVRDADKVRKLHDQFGVNAVIGSTDEVDKLVNLAADADVIFATTNCNDLPAAQAILAGAKKRFEKTGIAPALIHTSGTAALCDNAEGAKSSDVVWDDLNVPQIETLPDSALYRHVDLPLLAADKEGYVRTYLVLPSIAWGIATGPLFSAGISHHSTIILPILVKQSLERGRVVQFGEGLNKWAGIEIHELGDLYIKLFDAIVNKSEGLGHGREGYYFGESDEIELGQLSRALGKALVGLGKIEGPEPVPYTKEEVAKYWGGMTFLGGNSRCKGNRMRKLGWNPVKNTKDMFDAIQDEVAALLGSS